MEISSVFQFSSSTQGFGLRLFVIDCVKTYFAVCVPSLLPPGKEPTFILGTKPN